MVERRDVGADGHEGLDLRRGELGAGGDERFVCDAILGSVLGRRMDTGSR